MKVSLCITCGPEALDQGLFGNVLTHPFQILPYLYERGIFPAWELRSKHYGDPPDMLTIPGVVDLAYTPPEGPYRSLELNEMRRRHGQILGGDWITLSKMWNAYFKVPQRVLDAAQGILPPGRTLGIHYRGTDKQTSSWDSNPITPDAYISLIRDFLSQNEAFHSVFVGTDEPSFVDRLQAQIRLPIQALGAAEFHMAAEHSTSRREKSDRAMLDCILLSRCDTVIETSSALPSFTKIFNPSLPVYRCSASKLFSNMPYFPVAYIPVLPVSSPESQAILCETMRDDWSDHPATERFRSTFSAAPRWPRNHAFFKLAERAGAADLAARFVTGYH